MDDGETTGISNGERSDHQATQHQLRERVKELRCLYDLSRLVDEDAANPEELLTGVVSILCRSWQYEDVTCARIAYGPDEYRSDNYRATPWHQRAPILRAGAPAGEIEVGYLEERPAADEGPFLAEERDLISAVAERLGHVLGRWESERQLRDNQALLQRILDNARDMIYRMSLPDGHYEFVNGASEEVFGLPPETFLERPALIREVIHPDFTDYLAHEWEKLLAGDMSPSYEYKIIDGEGNERWLHQRNVLVTDDDGSPVAIEGVVTDVTDHHRLIDELETSRKTLDATVEQRTRELAEKVNESERRAEIINRQSEEILALSTPVLTLHDGILVAPLIGTLDSQRTSQLTEVILSQIEKTGSEVTIIDITGVPMIDTRSAQHLLETAAAIRLLGSTPILTGLRPSIAQTIVHLGVDLHGLATAANLSQGLQLAMTLLRQHASL